MISKCHTKRSGNIYRRMASIARNANSNMICQGNYIQHDSESLWKNDTASIWNDWSDFLFYFFLLLNCVYISIIKERSESLATRQIQVKPNRLAKVQQKSVRLWTVLFEGLLSARYGQFGIENRFNGSLHSRTDNFYVVVLSPIWLWIQSKVTFDN